ncbi:MAG TPA: glycosyltransferase family 1 protein [Anaerolineales bacterium]|nr:glycosyltransferase family 1 protein [Anaerolineales bacterium]
MKLVVDLLPCQTESRKRGIGRYSLALAKALAQTRQQHEMVALFSGIYPETVETLRQEFIRLLPPGGFLPYYHPPVASEYLLSDVDFVQSKFDLAVAFQMQAYSNMAPDMVLCLSPFEGLMEKGVVSFPNQNPKHLSSAILYDLIPLIYQEEYFGGNIELEKWYQTRYKRLNNFDLLFSISECTRKDAINLLKLDPNKIVTINGAIDPIFKKVVLHPEERLSKLRALGIFTPFIFYVSGADYRKNRLGLVKAFGKLPQETLDNHSLVINKASDHHEIQKLIKDIGLNPNKVIELEIDDEILLMLYNTCKLFVFPSLYEGFGLPVLEAMACGTPFISGNNSSLPEIIGRDDCMFDSNNMDAIVSTIQFALSNDAFRAEISRYGVIRSKEFSWENSAQKVWDAYQVLTPKIRRFYSSNNNQINKNDLKYHVLKEYISNVGIDTANNADILLLTKLATQNFLSTKVKRLLIDVTSTATIDHKTGIQRVVNKLVEHITKQTVASEKPLDIIPTIINNKLLLNASPQTENKYYSTISETISTGNIVELQIADTMLLLDSSWVQYQEINHIYKHTRGKAGRILSVVYDLIPILYPETCNKDVLLVEIFTSWLKNAIVNSDIILCISKSVANDLVNYIQTNNFLIQQPLDIYYWHLGADLVTYKNRNPIKNRESHQFLMVGTIEPRKNHAFVLKAFEKLWKKGGNATLIIVGKVGWGVSEFEQRLNKHPELNQRLFVITNATDEQIADLYQQSTALIAASIAEGFGLPIVEAALHKLPSLASDIPVFREVGGDGAIYFSLEHSDSLISAIETISEMSPSGRLALVGRVKVISWEESAKQVLEIIANKVAPYSTFPANSPIENSHYIANDENNELTQSIANQYVQMLQKKQTRIQNLLNQFSIERSRGWHNQFLQKLPKPLHSTALFGARLAFFGRMQAITSQILHNVVMGQEDILDLLRLVNSLPYTTYRELEVSQQVCKRLLRQYEIERLRGWHNRTLQKLPTWVGKTVRFAIRPFYLGRVQQIESEILSKIIYFEQSVAQSIAVS